MAQTIVDGSGASIPDALKNAMLRKVSDKFKDPLSTQFRRLGVVSKNTPNLEVICGQVNSKNSYGAYTGFEYFIYFREGNNDAVNTERLAILEVIGRQRPEAIAPYKTAGCLP